MYSGGWKNGFEVKLGETKVKKKCWWIFTNGLVDPQYTVYTNLTNL